MVHSFYPPPPPRPQQPYQDYITLPMWPDTSTIWNIRSINHSGGAHKAVLSCWSACLTSCPFFQTLSSLPKEGPGHI